MRILFVLIFNLLLLSLQAQQLPLLSEYNHNAFILNPGMVGWEGITGVTATYRHQWTGMPQSPRTASLSYQSFMEGNNMGYGGYLVHDQTGPTSFTGLNLTYAYHLRFKPERLKESVRNRLSIGLSLSGLGYRLRGMDLKYIDPDDDLIILNNEGQFFPDAGAGLFYYNDLFYVGFSVPQMISMKVKFDDATAISSIRRIAHFYLQAGAKIEINQEKKLKQKHYIMPSFWIKYAPISPLNINANVHYLYDDVFSTGIGYSTDGSVIIDASLYFKKQFRLGYAFSINTTGLASYVGSNHELMLTYVFKSNGKGWVFPKYEMGNPSVPKPKS